MLLGCLNLVVSGQPIICDDPFGCETWLIEGMLPDARRGDFDLFHAVWHEEIVFSPDVWDVVDSKQSCESHIESREGP